MVRRALSQPGYILPIDRTNPLAVGLVSATYATESHSFFDMLQGRFFTDPYPETSFSKTALTAWGRGRSTGGGNYRNYIQINSQASAAGQIRQNPGKQTLLVLLRPKATPATGSYHIVRAGSNDGWYMGQFFLSAGAVFQNAITNGPTLVSDSTYVIGNLYALVGTCDVSVDGDRGVQNFYVNGIKQASAGAYAGPYGKSTEYALIGSSGTSDTHDTIAVMVWNRALTPDEARSISLNPYQVFMQRGSVLSAGATLIQQMGLSSYLGTLQQLSSGSGRKPLVLLNGELRERLATEGVPVVLEGGRLRTLKAGETLIY